MVDGDEFRAKQKVMAGGVMQEEVGRHLRFVHPVSSMPLALYRIGSGIPGPSPTADVPLWRDSQGLARRPGPRLRFLRLGLSGVADAVEFHACDVDAETALGGGSIIIHKE